MSSEEESDDDLDENPRIAILGAGPIGLEAALYARYLGYEVAVLEKQTVASNVLRWGHVKMFSPFAMNRSPLGAAAMQAQHDDVNWPTDDALLTGREYAESYLLPLSKTDLLAGCIHERVEVLAVGRDGILKTDQPSAADAMDREDFAFRLLVRTPDGEDFVDADVVIDTTGVLDQANPIGHGGLPAVGELAISGEILRHVPDILVGARDRFEGKRVLVVGTGYSAATSIVALAQLHRENADTHTTWLTRREAGADGPMPLTRTDPLPERTNLSELANSAAMSAGSGVTHLDQTSVLGISRSAENGYDVICAGKLEGTHSFDIVISNTGYRPNTKLTQELQVDLCEATEAIKSMGEWFSQLGPIDAIEQTLPGPQVLQVKEPDLFVLGSKSFGRNSNFLIALGLQQIRDAFTIIADREDLDLYKTMAGLV